MGSTSEIMEVSGSRVWGVIGRDFLGSHVIRCPLWGSVADAIRTDFVAGFGIGSRPYHMTGMCVLVQHRQEAEGTGLGVRGTRFP